MDDASGNGEPPSQLSLQARAVGLDEREAFLRTMHDTVEARAQAIEGAQRLVDMTRTEIEAQNNELRQVNAQLVTATLAAQELREAAQTARRRQDEFWPCSRMSFAILWRRSVPP